MYIKEKFQMGKYLRYNDELEENLRTVRARNYVFSKDEMLKYRIVGIYNSIGEISRMSNSYIVKFAEGVYNKFAGEIATVETSIQVFPLGKKGDKDEVGDGEMQVDGSFGTFQKHTNPLKVVSVIVFVDRMSWELYALKNIELYGEESLLGMRN